MMETMSCSTWSRAHRPTRVLDAPGMSGDYYTQPVAWGATNVCAAMGAQVLIFDPDDTAGTLKSFVNVVQRALRKPQGTISPGMVASESASYAGERSGAPRMFTPQPRNPRTSPAGASPSAIRPVPTDFEPYGSPVAVDVSAVAFAMKHRVSPDSIVVFGDRRGRVILLRTDFVRSDPAGTPLVPTTLRAVPHDVVDVAADPAAGAVPPHAFGVTALDCHADFIVAGFGFGVVEVLDVSRDHTAALVARLSTTAVATPTRTLLTTASAPSTPPVVGESPILPPGGPRSAVMAGTTRIPDVGSTGSASGTAGGPSVTSVAFSTDGAMLACGANDGVVRVWSLSRPNEPVAAIVHRPGAVRAAWSPTHPGVVASVGGSLDGCVALSSIHVGVGGSLTTTDVGGDATVGGGGTCLAVLDTKTQVANVSWTDDGAYVVTTHGFSRDELAARNAGAVPSQLATTDFAALPSVVVPPRSLSAWAVHFTTTAGVHEGGVQRPPSASSMPSRPSSRSSHTHHGVAPLARRADNMPHTAGPKPTLVVPVPRKPMAGRSSGGGSQSTPTHRVATPAGVNWDTVELSPPVSPRRRDSTVFADDSMSVPRGRMNRLDLMPFAAGDGVAPSATPSSRNGSRCGSAQGAPLVAGRPGATLTLAGSLKGHSARPLHLARRGRPRSGQFVTASGGDGDATLRFWKPFTSVGSSSPSCNVSPVSVSPLEIPPMSSSAIPLGRSWDSFDGSTSWGAGLVSVASASNDVGLRGLR